MQGLLDMLTKIEIDNPEALAKYYRLLLSLTRVITSVVLSRGAQNDQTIEGAKGFLVENRPLVVAMLKRQARIGGVSFDDEGVDIDDLVELFVLLIALTDFLDVSAYRSDQNFDNCSYMISMKSNEIPKSHESRAFLHSVYRGPLRKIKENVTIIIGRPA